MSQSTILDGQKENVVIQAGACSLTVLPAYGGKIASLTVDGQQLLQTPLARIAPRNRDMGFEKSDASGWDECLPSVAACTVSTGAGSAQVPDHGDLWRVEWTEASPNHAEENGAGSSVHLVGKCFSLPLDLERTLTLSETRVGWRLSLLYKLTNRGSFEAPWSWAAHPLFAAAAGDRVILPDSIRTLRLEGSGGERLGKGGAAVSWPLATLADGSTSDLSVAQSAETEIGDKLFAGPLAAAENWCALERPSAGVRIRVSFDPAATPYLGLWICYGGWPERPGPKQTCVALEPATAPVDSLATSGSWSRTLRPGASFSWPMVVDIQRL